jgi:hypothetical protein
VEEVGAYGDEIEIAVHNKHHDCLEYKISHVSNSVEDSSYFISLEPTIRNDDENDELQSIELIDRSNSLRSHQTTDDHSTSMSRWRYSLTPLHSPNASEVNSIRNHSSQTNILDEEQAFTPGEESDEKSDDVHDERNFKSLPFIPVALIDVDDIHSFFKEYALQYPHFLENFPLFLRSNFYSYHNCNCITESRKWKMYYFTFNEYGIFYKLNYTDPFPPSHDSSNEHSKIASYRFIDVFNISDISIENQETFEFSLLIEKQFDSQNHLNSDGRNRNNKPSKKLKKYYFRAHDRVIFYAVLHKLFWYQDRSKECNDIEIETLSMKAK